jgi:predicted DCC family thiol-disulfide oxidoreductase YuxK
LDNLVIFDGVCKFCEGSVRFILRHESAPLLRFAPVQSATGRRQLRHAGLDPDDAESFVLLMDGTVYVKSDAAIRLARQFRGAWRLLAIVRLVPRPLRDRVYDVIARNRYRWFGRYDACVSPPPDMRARFIDD